MVTKTAPTRRRFTAAEYHRMGRGGVFHPDERVELIEGEIIRMAAVGDPHIACVIRLGAAFTVRLVERAVVSVQNPVRLSPNSEPEPDLVLFQPPPDHLGAPRPDEIRLLIEVSDTTLAYDRGIKQRLYARAGIAENWIWDLKRRRVLIFRDPVGGSYQESRVVTEGTLAPAAFPDLAISIDAILG